MILTSVVLVTLTASVITNDRPQQQGYQPQPTPVVVVQHSDETHKSKPTTPTSESAWPPRTKSENRRRGLGLFAATFKLLNPIEWLAVSVPLEKPKPSEQ